MPVILDSACACAAVSYYRQRLADARCVPVSLPIWLLPPATVSWQRFGGWLPVIDTRGLLLIQQILDFHLVPWQSWKKIRGDVALQSVMLVLCAQVRNQALPPLSDLASDSSSEVSDEKQ